MRKIVRVLGKRGRITIPYEIRIRNNIGYNDILSFEEKDASTIILRKEKLCGGCSSECFDEADDFSIEDIVVFQVATFGTDVTSLDGSYLQKTQTSRILSPAPDT